MGFKIAVSGLRAASSNLDVTGNNIANANTTGFKRSRAEFSDVYPLSNLGISKDAEGHGVQVAAVAQQFTQGNVTFTDNNLDLAVSGDGFFMVEQGGTREYTRNGTFGVDKDGYVVNNQDARVIGFGASNGVVTGALSPLQLSTATIAPQATTSVDAGVNLDSSDTAPAAAFDPADATTYNSSTSLTVYDSLGAEHLATMYFRKTATANQWTANMRVDGDNTQTLGSQTLTFNTGGQLTSAQPVGFGSFTPTNGAAAFTPAVDFTSSTQVGSSFGVFTLGQDGYSSGRLAGVDIDGTGNVLARFTNGQSEIQGQVALAGFGNSQGLQPAGESNWFETNSSGPPKVGAPGSASLGLVQAGALEESNVDLSEELVNMITAQRSFQANAQMIRTEDEVTQTIINIR